MVFAKSVLHRTSVGSVLSIVSSTFAENAVPLIVRSESNDVQINADYYV